MQTLFLGAEPARPISFVPRDRISGFSSLLRNKICKPLNMSYLSKSSFFHYQHTRRVRRRLSSSGGEGWGEEAL